MQQDHSEKAENGKTKNKPPPFAFKERNWKLSQNDSIADTANKVKQN